MKRALLSYGVWLKDGKIFLLEREVRKYRLPWPTVWEIPGGKVDWGENPADTAVREFQEETGLPARNPRLLGMTRDDDEYAKRNIHYFLVDAEMGDVRLGDPEHVAWKLVPLDEAARIENLAWTTISALYLLREWGMWEGQISASRAQNYTPELFLPYRGKWHED